MSRLNVNREFLMPRDSKDLEICDYVPLNNNCLAHIFPVLFLTASDIFKEISKKHFDKEEKDVLSAISWHRARPKSPRNGGNPTQFACMQRNY